MHIRKAQDTDAQQLTRIAFSAKQHWGYPEEYYQIWENELTITPSYISGNDVYLASEGDNIRGFYSVIVWQGEPYLDHIFIDPSFLKRGIGSQLIQHLIQNQREKGIAQLKVLVDPNAVGFYNRMGAAFIEYVPSNIAGRVIPLYILHLDHQ